MDARRLTLLVILQAIALTSCQRQNAPPRSDASPTFQYVKEKQGGCGDLFLYKGSADDLEVLWISVDKKKLKLPDKGTVSFDLATAPDGVQVAIDLWESAPRFRAYCNDISPDAEKRSTWKANKGKLFRTMLEPVTPAQAGPSTYKASARLEGVVFEGDAGHKATLDVETISEVLVAWYAGCNRRRHRPSNALIS
jgi:hypothetical protein